MATARAPWEPPEVRALDGGGRLIRIPPETDVPLTPRVVKLIDSAAFARLRGISQLGLVGLVYPAAHHTRFEHSLGVFRTALLYLRRLGRDPAFRRVVETHEAELLIAAALLHDIGHWPFCHAIEDMRLPDVPKHEALAAHFLNEPEIEDCLRRDWGFTPADVQQLLSGGAATPSRKLLGEVLSGPIDIDKVDYLDRDSLHAGVPYGRHFDRQRLVSSLCLNATEDGLAITQKGRTAAELMVFARYVMFSEVYWHHAVRSATAMLQLAFYRLRGQADLASLFRSREPEMIAWFHAAAAGDDATTELVDGLFGPRRRLYKRTLEFTAQQQPEAYAAVARRPYTWLVEFGRRLTARAEAELGLDLAGRQLIVDAPPVKREGRFQVSVRTADGGQSPLEEASPVVAAFASEKFDDYVKRVRVFAPPDAAPRLRGAGDAVAAWARQEATQLG